MSLLPTARIANLTSGFLSDRMGSSTLSLVVVGGVRQGETLEFQPGASIRIGRIARGNTFPIKDAGISTKHMCIEFEFNSAKWVVRDLESSNGTFLNGACLIPNTAFDLHDGDSIKLGEETSILIKIDCYGESQLRRNPRRRGVVKDGTVATVAETRDCNNVAVEEDTVNYDVELDHIMMLESRRQGRQRKRRALKDVVKDGSVGAVAETRDYNSMAIEESTVKHDVEVDNIMVLESRRQGRQSKRRALKDENGDQTEGKKTEELLGVITGYSKNPGRRGMTLKDRTVEHEAEGDKIMVLDGRRQGAQRKVRVLKDETGDQTEGKKTEELLGVIAGDAQNRSREGMFLKDSTVKHEVEGNKIMVLESQRRGKPRKGRGLKEENGDKGEGKTEEHLGVIKGDSQNLGRKGTAPKDGIVEHRTEGDTIINLESRKRGLPRNVRAVKDENCDEVEGKKTKNLLGVTKGASQNAGPTEGNIVGRMSTRRNRAVKGDENVLVKPILNNIPENTCLEGEKRGPKVGRTRTGGRKRNNLLEEQPDNVQVDNLEDSKYFKQMNSGKVTPKDDIEEIENISVGVATIVSDVCKNEDKNGNKEPCSVEEGSVNVEIDSKTDVKENKDADKFNLEKMTVAEWFDYLEVHLPAQIIDETEDIIECMKKKAARLCEYVLQQKNEKGNLPLV